MKASDYRRQFEAQVPQTTEGAEVTTVHNAVPDIEAQLALLEDKSGPEGARWDALQHVQAATFLGPLFDPYRARYLAVLRDLATDAAPALRRTALERLSALKDSFAQQLLAKGLENPAQALVSTASALEFLSLDEHSAAPRLARLVLDRNEDIPAKVAALRALVSDPSATDIFAQFMRDKAEFKEVRQISAVALQKLNKTLFESVAEEIAVDPGDFDDIRATAWSALARTPVAERLLSNPAVRASAEAVGTKLATGAFKALLSRMNPNRNG